MILPTVREFDEFRFAVRPFHALEHGQARLKGNIQAFGFRDFDLEAFAARSFGLWQGEPEKVVLRFTGDAAAEAANWCFHPSQSVAVQPDGSTVVRFCAAGRLEMCLHLFGWGDTVDILAPEGLREMLAEFAAAVARHHRMTP